MTKNIRISARSLMTFLLIAAITSAFIGCGATVLTPGYTGGKIRTGYQIPLMPDGEQTGAYRSDDLSVHYRYVRKGDELSMAGTVRFGSGTQFNFNYVDYFNLSLLVGDSQGTILANHALASASWVNLTGANSQVNFSKNLRIPPDAAVMAFTYTGQASEGGSGGDEEGGGNIQFWEYPISR